MPAGKGLSEPLATLGLVGDGDEVAAVKDVERTFGILLDDSDAKSWRTASDVYDALLRALDHEPIGAWRRFSRAIAAETGVDPERVIPETLLIRPPR
jgi:hypothetical protein